MLHLVLSTRPGSAGTDQRPANAGVEDGPGGEHWKARSIVQSMLHLVLSTRPGSTGTDPRPANAGVEDGPGGEHWKARSIVQSMLHLVLVLSTRPGRAGTNLCPGVAGSGKPIFPCDLFSRCFQISPCVVGTRPGSAGTDLRPASAGSGKLLSYVRKMREESDDQVFQARDPQLFFSIGVTALQRNPGRGCRRSSALRRRGGFFCNAFPSRVLGPDLFPKLRM